MSKKIQKRGADPVFGITFIWLTRTLRLQYTNKAVDSARAARKKRWICFFIILIVLIIVGVVVGVVVSNNLKHTGSVTGNVNNNKPAATPSPSATAR